MLRARADASGADAVVSFSGPRAEGAAHAALRALHAAGAPYLNGTRPFSDRGSRPTYRARATTNHAFFARS